MDFSYLLELAKANEEKSKNEGTIKFSTKISSAKKIDRGGPKPDAIAQLLNKIEKEKQDKEKEFEKKKKTLLDLRAENKHSKKRVHSLINRTKGASKSVLEDAKDITTAKGEAQCDEDDYGYESAMSQKIFSKLQNVYSEMPEDERLKFKHTPKASIEEIKNRVMNSLKVKQEEDLGIRKRKRNRKKAGEEDDGFINDGDEYKKFELQPETSEKSEKSEKKEEKEEKEKKKYDKKTLNLNKITYKSDKYHATFKYEKDKSREMGSEKEKKRPANKAPPPMSFEELMKVAQKKQGEPIPMIDPLLELEKKKEKAKEIMEDRPLTAKEKKELEEEKIRKLRRIGKLPPDVPASKQKGGKEPPHKELKENKQSQPEQTKVNEEKPCKNLNKSRFFALPNTSQTITNELSTIPKNPPKSSMLTLNKAPPQRKVPPPGTKMSPLATKISPLATKISHRAKSPPAPIAKIKKEAPVKSKPPTREFSPPYFPTKKSVPPTKKRIDSDDEDEYDSEMDDFIDDGEEDIDYSSEIAKMFKYDKSKFRGIEEDDSDMEASFSQVEKEEKFSAHVGLMEDLQDIQREEEEKKNKKKRLKK